MVLGFWSYFFLQFFPYNCVNLSVPYCNSLCASCERRLTKCQILPLFVILDPVRISRIDPKSGPNFWTPLTNTTNGQLPWNFTQPSNIPMWSPRYVPPCACYLSICVR